MSQDHYVWIGPPSSNIGQVYMPDVLVAPIDPILHHLEPMRGSGYTLAVFDKSEWSNYLHGVKFPRCLGYTTVHALGLQGVQSAKEWMAHTGYKWEGPK